MASGNDIVPRIRDYFERQIAWFERILDETENLKGDLVEDQIEKLSAQGKDHAEGTAAFQNEFAELLPIWESATALTETDRAEIHDMAQRAQKLAETLCAIHESAVKQVNEKATGIEASLQELRRGHELLGKYGPRGARRPSFIDRKA